MVLSNYHSHTPYCDGRDGCPEMARTACESGYRVLGFSAHAPLPFGTEWNMDETDMGRYASEVRALAQEYRGRMEVLLGYEMDYLAGTRGPASDFWRGVDRDFAIGSVHYLRAPDGSLSTVDDKPPVVKAFLDAGYSGDGKRLALDYWAALRSMVAEGGFDILGHFDLVKKNALPCGLFTGSEPWYRDAAMECAQAAARSGVVVEVNTGGLARGSIRECYPSAWIISEMDKLGIRLTVDSDAHESAHLAYSRFGYEALRASGVRECWYLSGGEWKAAGLSD